MIAEGFRKFYWGFLFILMSFRIQGFDILPDIVGFILLAGGLGILASESEFFQTAQKYTLPMIFLSIFGIYEPPVAGSGIGMGILGPFGILIFVASVILTLLIAYNIFMGIKDMGQQRSQEDIVEEAEQRWNQFMWLHIALLFMIVLFIVPPLAVLYVIILLIAAIALTIAIMGFMKRCEEALHPNDTEIPGA